MDPTSSGLSTPLIDERLDALWRAWSVEPQTLRAERLKAFAPAYGFNSGKIENDAITMHDTREVFERGRVVAYTGDVRTLFEIQNLKSSWEWGCDTVERGFSLDEALVLKAHELLCAGTYDERRWSLGERPGAFKVHDYAVGLDQEIGCPPEEVAPAMGELLGELAHYASEKGLRALKAAAYLHARLVEIHPFADGNGRTARLLTNMWLMRAGLPPVVVSEADRLSYYGALDAFHREGDLGPFVSLLKVDSLRTWENVLAE